MTTVVGIDVAKHTFDVALPLPNGKFRTRGKIANDPKGFQALEDWLSTHAGPEAWVVMEATGIYHERLAEHLHQCGYRVSVLNPARVLHYARSQLQRVKTDRADAKLIALYGQRHADDLVAWQPEPPAQKRLRALVRRLDDLKEMRQMEANRLETADDRVRPSIESVLAHIDKEIAETLKAIDQHIDDDPDLRGRRDLLVSIDGISDRTAGVLLAELGDPLRFRNARALVAFAGLNPRLQQSGLAEGSSRISRTGSSRLRAGLYMPALVATAHNVAVRALKERLKARGKTGKQVICAAMGKLLRIVYGVLKSGRPFDAQLALAP
jgi:transposase